MPGTMAPTGAEIHSLRGAGARERAIAHAGCMLLRAMSAAACLVV